MTTWRTLFEANQDIPQDLLSWWLADILDRPLTGLPLDDSPPPDHLDALATALPRLRNGEPIQYICGRAPFRDLMLKVDPRVLIPRPETEQLVQLALDQVIRPGDRVLDVGTGSGCIALALKYENPGLTIEAADLSPDALDVARENASAYKLDITFRQADLLSSEPPQSWDVIVSNPPYIGEDERDHLPANVRDHEPAQALFSGSTGLDSINRMLAQALDVLKPEGRLLMETGETQHPDLLTLSKNLGYRKATSIKDLANRPRFLLVEM